MDTLLVPLRAAASLPARRAYLTTFLLSTSAIFLLFLASGTYLLFYHTYIPHLTLTAPLHLQYTPSHPPTAHIPLPPSTLHPHQPYTITLHLRLPNTPSNINTGNFMLHLTLHSALNTTLASSHRPTTLLYRSPLLERLDTLLRAPLLLAGFSRQEQTLHVVLFEAVVLQQEARGVTLVLGSKVAVYDVVVEFAARLEGLRWVMYRWRVTSFVLATAVFWGIEVVFMVAVWWGVYSHFEARRRVVPGTPETEEEEEEEEERGEEEYGGRRVGYPTPEGTPGVEEGGSEVYADDEEEGEVVVGDSGLGSMSESAGSSARARAAGEEGQRRRRS